MAVTVVDVETANHSLDSICQIGFCVISGDKEVRCGRVLVNPRQPFTDLHSSIHGISVDDVREAPEIGAALDDLFASAEGFWVSHTSFDRAAISLAATGCGRDVPSRPWLDSARLARRVWPQYAKAGYGLRSLARALGHSFNHHDALEDARAAALILRRAMADGGLSEEDLPDFLGARTVIPGFKGADPTGEGVLSGETVAITGALSAPRRQFAEVLAAHGAKVDSGVNARTTLLVVGDLDPARLAGKAVSTKQVEAEAKIAAGQPIRIVSEQQIVALIEG